MNIYYVYIYRHPKTLSPFYVGYGKNNRYLAHLHEAIQKPTPTAGEHKLNTIRQLLRLSLEPIISIVDANLSKEQACELEEFLIELIGRRDLDTGPLTNQTMGGDGTRDWSITARLLIGAKRQGLVSARDPVTGKLLKIHKDDPLWVSGQLVGHNSGKTNVTNKAGKLSGYIQAKDTITGECFRIKKDDPRWVSGELVGVRKGLPSHPNTILAARAKKGVPKSANHGAIVSKALTGAIWIHNFSTNQSKRLTNGNTEIPEGFVKVSGPHKLTIL